MKSKFDQERRDVLKGACALAGATVMVSISGSVPAFAQDEYAQGEKGVPQVGDVFVFNEGAKKGKVVTVADIVADAPPVLVQAKAPGGAVRTGDKGTVLLYRVAPEKIPADMKSDTVNGVMAYTAVCTHLGCILSNWDAKDKWFLCPCHDATFDPLREGKNTGGPSVRDLPYIPIKSKGGTITVANVPSGYIGVERPM